MLITRKAEFSASHRLPQSRVVRRGEPRSFTGRRPTHGHGHNYVVEVTIDGTPDPVTGMMFDLKQLKDIIQREVIDPMDHRFLNYEVKPFDAVVPTAENIAIEIWTRLRPHLQLPNARLHRIRLL